MYALVKGTADARVTHTMYMP